MPQTFVDGSLFSADVREFLGLLHKNNVDYMIVGGEAVIYYGYARLTGDIDFFYNRENENALKLFSALDEFWDKNIPGIKNYLELLENGLILQFGRPPHRIDIINCIDGVSFEEAKSSKLTVLMKIKEDHTPIYYIGLNELIKNKEASARPKDIDDLAYLRKARNNPSSS
ncbi:MAG: hypothetical protein Q8Q33_06075 [Chlamydiota bacterium]|nr:hypothetical protein [Chlamydiota bacterium]